MEALDFPEPSVKTRLARFINYLNTPLPCYICQHYSYIHECRSYTNVEHLQLLASLACHHVGILGLLRRLVLSHRVYSKLLSDNVDNSEQCCDIECLISLRQSLADQLLPYGFDHAKTVANLDALIPCLSHSEEGTNDHQCEDDLLHNITEVKSTSAETSANAHSFSILWAHAADEFESLPAFHTDQRYSGLHRSWLSIGNSCQARMLNPITSLTSVRLFQVYCSPRPPELSYSMAYASSRPFQVYCSPRPPELNCLMAHLHRFLHQFSSPLHLDTLGFCRRLSFIVILVRCHIWLRSDRRLLRWKTLQPVPIPDDVKQCIWNTPLSTYLVHVIVGIRRKTYIDK